MTELEIAELKTETRVSKKVVIPMDSVTLAVTCNHRRLSIKACHSAMHGSQEISTAGLCAARNRRLSLQRRNKDGSYYQGAVRCSKFMRRSDASGHRWETASQINIKRLDDETSEICTCDVT